MTNRSHEQDSPLTLVTVLIRSRKPVLLLLPLEQRDARPPRATFELRMRPGSEEFGNRFRHDLTDR